MLDACQLSKAVASKEVSCCEVMEAYLDHIARVNPLVNAVVSLRDRETLIAEARERDEELARGKYRGWMHGFPQAVKDLVPTKDIRTTRGSLLYKNLVPGFDAPLVRRMKEAGSIIIGKTNTPEFGLGSHTDNDVFGTTLNAYDPSRSAGGSSGGAAVSVALRMLPVADGSDHAGSLRNPAAFNNVFGFRPSAPGALHHTCDICLPILSVTGPVARTFTDLARALSVQNGHDPVATLAVTQDRNRLADPFRRDFKGTRIAWLGDFDGYLAIEPALIGLCQSALQVFEALGCQVESARPTYPLGRLWEAWVTLRAWQIGGSLKRHAGEPDRARLLRPQARWEIESGSRLSAYDVFDALVARRAWCQEVCHLFETYEYLLLPAAQAFPFDATWQWPKEVAGRPGSKTRCPPCWTRAHPEGVWKLSPPHVLANAVARLVSFHSCHPQLRSPYSLVGIQADGTSQFETGANRDTDGGKSDYEGLLSPFVIEAFCRRSLIEAFGAHLRGNRHLKGHFVSNSRNCTAFGLHEIRVAAFLRLVARSTAACQPGECSTSVSSVEDRPAAGWLQSSLDP
jgi:amidase